MITVKNVRPSLVLVSDARLRLGPGQVLPVDEITPHLQALLDTGALVRLDVKATSVAASPVAPNTEDVPITTPARPEPKRLAESTGRRKAEGTPDAG
ncbi:MAG: hypothetical protein ACYDBB_08655 [Armatimonadota bacterium]